MEDFKVYCRDCNGQFTDITSIERVEKYLEDVVDIELSLDVKLPAIKRVDVGNASYPITEIVFENGLHLYSRESLGGWYIDNPVIYEKWRDDFMNVNAMLEVSKSLKGIKGGLIKKWVSHDTHEEIIVVDCDKNTYEIKFTPAKK